MKTIDVTITWTKGADGIGRLRCECANGHVEYAACDVPITAGSDSWSIAAAFGDPLTVERDRESVTARYALADREP